MALGPLEPGAGAPRPPSWDMFFGKEGLDQKRLALCVETYGPIERGSDGRLWHYQNGVWLPGGEDEVGRRVRDLLGPKFRVAYLNGTLRWFQVSVPKIDGLPHLEFINTLNGLLRWRTGDLEPHRPDLFSTVQLPVLYDPGAECPIIDAWLAEVIPADAVDFVDELLGYLVLNGNPLHRAILLLGSGRNGKGTFIRLVAALLGSRNVSNVPLQTLGEHRFAAASLYGKLANLCGDLDRGVMERSDTFKMATGGDTIYAEHKYGQSFEFEPWCTMLFSANAAPPSRDTSIGYYSRWVIVPFAADLRGRERPEEELDGELQQPAELQGLLARAIRGLQRLMARGRFELPPSVADACETFRRDTDTVASFASECLTADPTSDLPRAAVYTRFKWWCEENGHRPPGAGAFYDRLVAAIPGSRQKTVKGVRKIDGVAKGDGW